jgi:pimeloyl-ACP methyl ester carboxylesterase
MKIEIPETGGAVTHVGTGSRPFTVEDNREVVLFVHGAALDHTVWVMQTRYFARQGYAVLAPDLPGHGRSGGAPLTSVEAMADWLAELLQVLGIDRATVVGHSMGALVAYAFGIRHAERTSRLVLFGTSIPMPVADALLGAAADDDHAAFEMANTWSHSTRGSLGGNPVPGMWVIQGGERLMERSAPGVFSADLTACNRFAPTAVPAMTAPVTIVIGTQDKMTPSKAGLEVAAALGDSATVRTLVGSGHSMMSECPNEVLDILIEALAVAA